MQNVGFFPIARRLYKDKFKNLTSVENVIKPIDRYCNGRRYNFYVNFLYQCYDRSCPKSIFEGFMLHEKKGRNLVRK